MVKISLIGTHGTGKTTIGYELASELKKKRKDVQFIGEVSRECPLPINEGTTKEAQRWILYTQMAKELEASSKYSHLITDRGVIDNYCYYLNQFGEEKDLDLLVNAHTKTYDFIFKIPIGFVPNGLKEDGIRSIDPIFQKEIDVLISSEIKKRNIPFYEYRGIDNALEIILRK